MENEYGFDDFLGQLGGAYSAYVDLNKTEDAAKIAQAQAAAQAAAAQKEFAISDRAKQILLYGTGALLVIIVVLFVLKKAK
jgi:hypothetical protein